MLCRWRFPVSATVIGVSGVSGPVTGQTYLTQTMPRVLKQSIKAVRFARANLYSGCPKKNINCIHNRFTDLFSHLYFEREESTEGILRNLSIGLKCS